MAHGQDAVWPVYLGGKERDLYSSLDQINRGNVSQMEVAWTYETGKKLAGLIDSSYRVVALKRMLTALDDR